MENLTFFALRLNYSSPLKSSELVFVVKIIVNLIKHNRESRIGSHSNF